MTNVRIYILIVFAVISSLYPNRGAGQNNAYQINDKLYAYFLKCDKVKKMPQVLAMSDTLYRRAHEMNDPKAQCMAAYLRANYFIYAKNLTQFRIEQIKLRALTKRLGFTQYYFGSWNILINYYANKFMYPEAIREIKDYQHETIQLKSPYGIAFSYAKLGGIYMMRGQTDFSIQEYQKGIDYLKSVNYTKDIGDIYEPLGIVYLNQGNYPKAKEYLKLALKFFQEEGEKGNCYILLADCCFRLSDFVEGNYFLSLYEKWKKKYANYNNSYFYEISMYIHYYQSKGDYDKALEYARSLPNETLRQLQMSKIYYEKGDYRSAYDCFSEYMRMSNKDDRVNLNNSMAEYGVLFENERLLLEKNRLKLKNSMIALARIRAEGRMLVLDKDRSRLKILNANLELSNKNLLLQQQTNVMLRQKTETARQSDLARSLEEINSKNKKILLLLVLALIIIFAFSLIYIHSHRRHVQRVRSEVKQADDARREAVAFNVEAEKARCEAEKADQLKTLFLQNMSHEIRTPLNAIVGFSNLLTDDSVELDDGMKRDFAQVINSNTSLLTTLINDILQISSLESGNYKMHYEWVDLTPFCSQILLSLRGRAKEGVQLCLDVPPQSVRLYTDRGRTQELIFNFMTNACKFTETGSITLSYLCREHDVIFAVTDTGCGVNPSCADQIFDCYSMSAHPGQGSGLGLNLCARIAELYHGEVRLDTTYQKGARFTFVHPLQDCTL